MGKQKRTYSEEVKRKAIEEFVSGRKSAAQIAAENGVTPAHVYKWKTQSEEKAKGLQIEELESQGRSRADALLILQLQAERDAYQKMAGEQAVIVDLLKKRLRSTSSQQWNELTGLIETLEKSAQKQKREKR